MIVQEEVDGQKTQAFSNDYEKVLPAYYRLIRIVGRGGMAEVFLAEDDRLGRNVAIKFLNSEFRKDPERMRRFTQEARAASALNHPNILIIHDIGENEGVQYIVSEFVDGETIGSRVLRGKIPLLESIEIAIQITSALATSHRAGIVHRDLKPDNVMVRPDGSVKVLDFGLAKETRNDLKNSVEFDAKTLDRVSTSPGLILGTPQYMSPEQARGNHLDARSDIFSLGIILFEMVAGRPPFLGSSLADTIAAILTKEPKRLEEYLDDPPLGLIRIVQKTLRKNMDERYGTMDHLLSDLKDLKRELLAESFGGRVTGGTEVRPTLHQTVAMPAPARFAGWKAVVIALGVVGVGLAVWWLSGAVRRDVPIQASMRTVPITSWSSGPGELIAAASFSPNAEMVAFAATRSGATEIWVKPTEGGDAIQVTKNGYYNQYPVWSPNGREVAFFSSRGDNRGIWRAAFTGGEQSEIANGVAPSARLLRWGADGRIYLQENGEVIALDERSGERTKLTDFGSRGMRPRMIAISADASAIAYSLRENDLWKVMVRPLDAETAEEYGSSKSQIDNLSWRHDGKAVIYSSLVEGTYQIFESAGKGASSRLSNGGTDMYVQDVSADGSKILFGSVSETSDIWQIDTQDQKESLVANDVAAEYWAHHSPDGNSIVYQSVEQVDRPFGGSIKVKPPAGPPIVVSPSGFSPAWSNDGTAIAFLRRTDSEIGIWRVGPAGAQSVKLAEGTILTPGYMATPYLKIGINHLSWSPDSKRLAYSAKTDGMWNIWLAESDGSRNWPLTGNKDAKEIYYFPTWIPDGNAILFASEVSMEGPPRRTLYRLWVSRLGDAEQRLIYESNEPFRLLGLGSSGTDAILAQKADPADLTPAPESTYVYSLSLQNGVSRKANDLANAYIHNIHLSRDARSIAFVSRRENETALWTVPVSGGSPRKLLSENDPKVLFSSLSWSPDGRSIAFGKQTRTNVLSMLAK